MTRQRAEGHFGILAEMNWRQRDEGLCGPVWLEGGSLGCQEQELLQGAFWKLTVQLVTGKRLAIHSFM